MADYLFLFRVGCNMRPGHSPAEMQASMQKWLAGIGGIGKTGKLKGGQPLENGGKVIGRQEAGGHRRTYAEAKGQSSEAPGRHGQGPERGL